ncbi:MAG: hypothetical protein QF560_13670 [SAR324 cluster bacterium]|nr:hypothetical protein [Deltaproteobacteria bacterium]MDP6091845.1 hypothetical protein [SAR324 cluster bacterium]MBI12412.1 hypothetical protein [Deltaproteobacteria bacterium]MBP43948.1 hypothetical protein [Deltaproteobacteria bacterium]MDP6248828.1 hypothetical protein [SAR324 cluster bacterium]
MAFLRCTLPASEPDRFGVEPAVEVVSFLPGRRTAGMGEKICIRARAEAFDSVEPSTRTGTAGVVRLDHRPEVFLARDALENISGMPGHNFSFFFHQVSIGLKTTSGIKHLKGCGFKSKSTFGGTMAPDVLTRLSPYQLCLRQSSLRAPSGYACKGC